MSEDRINKKIAFGNNTQMQFSQWYGKVLYTFLYHEKGVVLLIVIATIMVIVILSGAILSIISSQSRLTHHQISRIKAYYAGKGIMNYAQDMLRQGIWVADAASNRYACHRDCSGLGVPSPDYVIPTDGDITYNILVTIYPRNQALGNTVTRLDIKTDYTYVP